jgi:hypothetical protein
MQQRVTRVACGPSLSSWTSLPPGSTTTQAHILDLVAD